jgi:hypothetical protein
MQQMLLLAVSPVGMYSETKDEHLCGMPAQSLLKGANQCRDGRTESVDVDECAAGSGTLNKCDTQNSASSCPKVAHRNRSVQW